MTRIEQLQHALEAIAQNTTGSAEYLRQLAQQALANDIQFEGDEQDIAAELREAQASLDAILRYGMGVPSRVPDFHGEPGTKVKR